GLRGVRGFGSRQRTMQVFNLQPGAFEMVDHFAEVTEFAAELQQEFDLGLQIGLATLRIRIAQNFEGFSKGLLTYRELCRIPSGRGAQAGSLIGTPNRKRTPSLFFSCRIGVSEAQLVTRANPRRIQRRCEQVDRSRRVVRKIPPNTIETWLPL